MHIFGLLGLLILVAVVVGLVILLGAGVLIFVMVRKKRTARGFDVVPQDQGKRG